MSIDANDLSKEVSKKIDDQLTTISEEMEETVTRLAKETVEELKQTSPRSQGSGGRKGHYADGWSIKNGDKNWRGLHDKIIYNKKKPQLTHLLENGHLKAGGKERVRGIPHIKPVEDKLIQKLEKLGG